MGRPGSRPDECGCGKLTEAPVVVGAVWAQVGTESLGRPTAGSIAEAGPSTPHAALAILRVRPPMRLLVWRNDDDDRTEIDSVRHAG